MIAWVMGFIGIVSAFGIGRFALAMNTGEVLQCIIAAYLAGLAALLLVLKGERTPWIKRTLLNGGLNTWAVFLLLYFGFMVGIGTPLLDGRRFAALLIPLVCCNGFTIITFGPIQDRIVAQLQRRARKA